MKTNDIDKFMQHAINEGRKAQDKCAPNPPVGCVVVKNGSIISSGYTNEPGEAHAEAMAASKLQYDLKGTSVFVTLEPCSYHGRTPSCAELLVKCGVQEVYVGMIDPHPKNQGTGIEILRDAGVEVFVGVLEEQVYSDIGPFLYKCS